MKPSIVCYKKLPAELKQKLEKRFTVTAFDTINDDNFAEFLASLEYAEGLIGSGLTIDRDLLQRAPRLRAVSTISAGYDNFDVAALTERRIPLMHTPDALTDTVADTIMALVLACGRRIINVAERVKAGEWKSSVDESWFGVDVHHKTMGIIGLGRIGSALVKRAHLGFDMKIVYHSRSRHAEVENKFDAIYMDLDKLMSSADYVCLILPLSPQTHHLINAEKLALMKPDAYFINAGRGPVVDERALIAALAEGKIAGAGLDVFEQEPLPADSPLLSMPNVVAVPHIGSATFEARYAMAKSAVKNLIAAMSDSIEGNCVNPQIIR